jgi:hypothetical protein
MGAQSGFLDVHAEPCGKAGIRVACDDLDRCSRSTTLDSFPRGVNIGLQLRLSPGGSDAGLGGRPGSGEIRQAAPSSEVTRAVNNLDRFFRGCDALAARAGYCHT